MTPGINGGEEQYKPFSKSDQDLNLKLFKSCIILEQSTVYKENCMYCKTGLNFAFYPKKSLSKDFRRTLLHEIWI